MNYLSQLAQQNAQDVNEGNAYRAQAERDIAEIDQLARQDARLAMRNARTTASRRAAQTMESNRRQWLIDNPLEQRIRERVAELMSQQL